MDVYFLRKNNKILVLCFMYPMFQIFYVYEIIANIRMDAYLY